MPIPSICILPALSGLGGPSSFRGRLARGLEKRGFVVHTRPDDPTTAAILVIGAPRSLIPTLLQARRRGVRVVQRLNGMNWIHRIRPLGLRYTLRAESNNLSLAFVRRWVAERVVYQSRFTHEWWDREYGLLKKPQRDIYNGVDLNEFSPGSAAPPTGYLRLLLVEAHFAGGFEQGLINAAHLLDRLHGSLPVPVELVAAGEISPEVRRLVESPQRRITFAGKVPAAEIPALDRSAHMLFSTDLNASCPNSVLEALACGLPVISYATGALPELVAQGGVIVPYGGDPWKLDVPDVDGLAKAALDVFQNQEKYRPAARRRAEELFGLDGMVERYLDILIG